MADIKKEDVEQFLKIRDSMDESNKIARDFYQTLEDTFDLAKKLNRAYGETYDKLNKEQQKLRGIDAEILLHTRQIESNNAQISALTAQIAEDEKEIAQLARQELSLTAQISEIKAEIADMVRQEKEIESALNSELKKQEVLEQHILKTKYTLKRIDDDILKNANERFQLGLQIAENARLQTDLAAELQSTSDYHERAIIEERIHKAKIQAALLSKKNTESEKTQNALLQERESVGKRLIKQQDAYEDSVRKAELFADNFNAAKKRRLELEGVSANLEEDLKKTQKDRMGIEERLGQMVAQRTALQEDTKKREYRLNNLHEERAKLLGKINKLQAQLNLLKLIQMAYERFVALDKAAEDFRRTTGFTVGQMAHIRKYAEEINVQFADMGVSIEQAYKSAAALANVFGRASLISKDAMMNVSLLSQNLGVAEEVSAQVLENFMGIGKSSEAAAFDTIKLGSVLSEKTGVPFAKVMDDVAKASETTINMIGGSPAKLMKAAIAARALGLDINKIAASQRKLLDFTSSINDELELSALLGKSISFQKARQLAYEGKSDEALKATLETVKKSGDFEKMNVYQREQLAKAAGMELKDLSKALAVEKQRDEILNGADEEKRQQLLMQEEELKKMKERSEEDEKDLIRQNQKALAQQKMQGVMTKLKNIMDSLSIAFADILEPVITALSDFVVPLFKAMVAVLKVTIIPLLKYMVIPLQKIGEYVGDIGKSFEGWSESAKMIGGGVGLLGILFAGKLGFGGIGKALSGSFGLLKTGLSKIPGLGGLGSAGKAVEGASKIGKSGGGLGSSLGKGIATFMKYVAKGISYFGNTNVLKGALGIALVGASIIPFAFAMKMFADVDWSAVGIGALALVGFTAAAFGLGLLLSTGAGAVVFGAGVLGIAALGMALIPFGVAAIAAGFGIKLLGEGISGAVDPILRLSEIDLTKTALGIGAIGAALAAFGAGSAGAGLGSFVGNLLGGDPIAKMERLAKVGPDLLITASAINMLSSAFQKFNEVDAFAKSIDVLTVSIGKMNDELEKTSLLKLTAIAAMTAASNITGGGGGATAGGTGGGDGIVEKLDAIHEALVGGKVAVYVDGIKVSKAIAQTS
jgi:hypothetical protein